MIWTSIVNVKVFHHIYKALSMVPGTKWKLAILSLLTSEARVKMSLAISLVAPVVSVMTVVCRVLCSVFVEENSSSVSLTWPLEAWVKQKQGHCYYLCALIVHKPDILTSDFYFIIKKSIWWVHIMVLMFKVLLLYILRHIVLRRNNSVYGVRQTYLNRVSLVSYIIKA